MGLPLAEEVWGRVGAGVEVQLARADRRRAPVAAAGDRVNVDRQGLAEAHAARLQTELRVLDQEGPRTVPGARDLTVALGDVAAHPAQEARLAERDQAMAVEVSLAGERLAADQDPVDPDLGQGPARELDRGLAVRAQLERAIEGAEGPAPLTRWGRLDLRRRRMGDSGVLGRGPVRVIAALCGRLRRGRCACFDRRLPIRFRALELRHNLFDCGIVWVILDLEIKRLH